jgi:gamma-glutamylcyclotransferase
MPVFKYFAYGSNMLTSRLVARCNSARAIGAAYIDGHQLSFSNQSIDGSGKGHLVAEPGRRAWSVVFEIDSSQKAALDEFEGTGYSCCNDFLWY